MQKSKTESRPRPFGLQRQALGARDPFSEVSETPAKHTSLSALSQGKAGTTKVRKSGVAVAFDSRETILEREGCSADPVQSRPLLPRAFSKMIRGWEAGLHHQ